MKLPFNLICLDIECTDSNPKLGSVIQLSAVTVNRNFKTEKETFDIYIQPLDSYRNPQAMAVNKITEEQMAMAYPLLQALKLFEYYCNTSEKFCLACVDSGTKIVTKDGIKRYNQVKKGDLVATYNLKSKRIEYQPILKINIYNHKGKLLVLNRKNKKYLFTPNHNFVYNGSDGHSYGKIRIKQIDKLWHKNFIYIPQWKSILGGKKVLTDNMVKLIAWILSEGSIYQVKLTTGKRMKKWGSCKISICQSPKSKYYKEILNLLKELKMKFFIYNQKDMIHLSAKENNRILPFVKKYELPKWLKDTTVKQKKIFLDEYIKGDGTVINKKKCIYFGKKRKRLAEEMQQIAIECGYKTRLLKDTCQSRFGKIRYTLHLLYGKGTCFVPKTKVDHKGIVWCPTTANHTWIAYKHGFAFITGNSWGAYFDIPFLKKQYEKINRKWPFGYKSIDLKSIAIWEMAKRNKPLSGGLKKFLNSLNMEFKGTPHNALDDIINTVNLLKKLK